jgi:ABC-2 type transport system ATP-binding protein
MRFPIPKRYREWMFRPFSPRRVVTALANATIEIQEGDRIAVMGPNGAGKTTLLKLIGGLLIPSEGEISVNGVSTLRDSVARRSIGYVLNEERSFFWRLTGAQNLEFFGTLDNLSGPYLKERVRNLMGVVGLDASSDKMVSGYSSGMKQKLAVARVLLSEPKLLILDEPSRALDPIACEEMVELILTNIQKTSRKTLLIATHRLEEAMTLCNKVMIIDGGRIRAFAAITDITSSGTSLLEFYRRNVASEGNHATASV